MSTKKPTLTLKFDNNSDYWYVKYYSKDFDNVIYDRKLFRQHHLNNTLSEKCLNYITSPFEAYYSDLVNKICKTDDMFKEIFRDRRRMFLPKKFDEVIAYKCGLIPFYYSLGEDKVNDEKVGLLISGNTNCDRVLACKLEAYQMLTNGTRDYENSQLREDRELFEYVIIKLISSRNFIISSILKYSFFN